MKKILAMILAVATAISMFASVSVSGIFVIDSYVENEGFLDAYNPVSLVLTSSEIVVVQKQEDPTKSDIVTRINDSNKEEFIRFVDHLELGDPNGTPAIFETLNELADGNLRYGKIYMYDYDKGINPEDNRAHKKALENFEEIVTEIRRSTTTNLKYTIKEFYEAWIDAYDDEPVIGRDGVSEVRLEAVATAQTNSRDARKHMYYDMNTNLQPDQNLFDGMEFVEYNMFTLIKLVYDLGRSTSDLDNYLTSSLIYVNNEYDRVKREISYADPGDAEVAYYDQYALASKYVESDFTAENWKQYKELLEEAEELAAAAVTVSDWEKATTALTDAMSVKGIAVTHTEMQRALMSVYADSNGKSKIDYVKKTYTGKASDKCLYNEEEFRVRPDGNGGYVYSDEWVDFAVNYYDANPSGMTSISEYSAYTKLYEVWEKVKKNSTGAKKSEVDEALENFYAAVDNLTPTSGNIEEWRIVMLRELVDDANALEESDFVTTSKNWKTLQDAIAAAENTLRKSNPSNGEISKVYAILEDALETMKLAAKAVPESDKETLRKLIKEADKLVANVTTQAGTQVVKLKEATEASAEVYDRIGLGTIKKATISEVKAAIESLEKAINSFNNPQGWYKEDGKWYYGVEDGVYADGWKLIGATWFMFNEDGSMKESEWFKVDGKWYYANANGGLAVGWAKVDGKWYFFNQGNAMKTGWVEVNGKWYFLYDSGAMAYSTTINGYKLGADGAWIA